MVAVANLQQQEPVELLHVADQGLEASFVAAQLVGCFVRARKRTQRITSRTYSLGTGTRTYRMPSDSPMAGSVASRET